MCASLGRRARRSKSKSSSSPFVEVLRAGGTRRFYAVDRLVLTRAATARSRPLARAHTLDCPNCGAPLEAVRGTECSYCRQNVGFGRFDWMIAGFSNQTRETRGPLLTSDVAESGTELPTIVDRGASQRFEQLQHKDPALSWQALQGRVALVFAELQAAWSGRDPMRIRPFVSDNLFQSMYYWIDLYTQERCRNVTENANHPARRSRQRPQRRLLRRHHPAHLCQQHRLHHFGSGQTSQWQQEPPPNLLRILDAHPRHHPPRRATARHHLLQLRRSPAHRHDRPMRVLSRQNHERGFRLGLVEDRTR